MTIKDKLISMLRSCHEEGDKEIALKDLVTAYLDAETNGGVSTPYQRVKTRMLLLETIRRNPEIFKKVRRGIYQLTRRSNGTQTNDLSGHPGRD